MDPSQVKVPPMKDLTPDNITPNAIIVNSQGQDRRLKFLLQQLITHLHDYARETQLTTEEWMGAINFLTAVGQTCTETRQEYILLSDILGLSTLVETINHPKPPGATEGTVLGPFHTDDALHFQNGSSIASEGKGEPCLVHGRILDTAGNPLANATIDVWETDDTGKYDTQYADRGGPDCRGIVNSDAQGHYWFKGIRPVPYPIPHDGPVGKMLQEVKRHPYRPSHMHFMIEKPGYDTLVTSLFIKGDPYETSDAVFGVKSSLQLDIEKVKDKTVAEKHGVSMDFWEIHWDFVMVSDEEAKKLKEKHAKEALEKCGSTAEIVNGLPVAPLD